jgi:hypothetical protein
MKYAHVSPDHRTCNRQPRRPGQLRRRLDARLRLSTVSLFVLLHALLLSTPSHAGWLANGTNMQGTNMQGTNMQGTNMQGTNMQGTNVQGQSVHGGLVQDRWTRDRRLIGVKSDPQSSALMLVAIGGFHGDVVDGLVWKRGQGEPERLSGASELIGLRWSESRCTDDGRCSSVRYRIAGGQPDAARSTMPGHGDNHDIWLYDIEYTGADEGSEPDWQSVCQPDSHGGARAMFLDGQWRADGSWDPSGHTIACTSGVLAKCARNWGYKPWKELRTSRGSLISLQPLHQACTRAARADYCGDGASHTRDGTLIDLFDRYGLNVREQVDGFSIEAGFNVDGAAWVARPRWPRGDEDRGDMVWLKTCARPRRSVSAGDQDPLIQVWSRARAPRKRR